MVQVSTKSPHHGVLDGSPKERPSRFNQFISQVRSPASLRPRAVLAVFRHAKLALTQSVWRVSCNIDQACLEQVDAGAAIHLAFEGIQPVDQAFGLSI